MLLSNKRTIFVVNFIFTHPDHVFYVALNLNILVSAILKEKQLRCLKSSGERRRHKILACVITLCLLLSELSSIVVVHCCCSCVAVKVNLI